MRAGRIVQTTEVHTGGEPFRIVTSGLPRLPGRTIVERRDWARIHHDDIRRALVLEPRGHADMYAGYLTDPVSPGADFGVVFVHNEGYSDHCGHGVIALATAAVELGWVARREPETRIGIDAPCGFIEAFVGWNGSRAGTVRFINVASYLLHGDVVVQTPGFGAVAGDIAFGGAFYVYVDGEAHGLVSGSGEAETLVRFGTEVTAAANAAFPVSHPEVAGLDRIYGTIIDFPPVNPGATQANVCVFADRQLDRSPTGSGTAGRAALLFAKGRLGIGATLVNDSIVGSRMSARILRLATVGGIDAVIPEIAGTACVIGQANWFLDPDDVLGGGFLVR